MGAAQFIVIGMLTVAGQTGGATPEQQQQPVRSQTDLIAPGKNLYGRLFQPSRNLLVPLQQNPVTTENAKPRVVCGMVVVPVKPDLDTRILVRPKNDPQTGPNYEYKIRTIAPQICSQ